MSSSGLLTCVDDDGDELLQHVFTMLNHEQFYNQLLFYCILA